MIELISLDGYFQWVDSISNKGLSRHGILQEIQEIKVPMVLIFSSPYLFWFSFPGGRH